MQGQSKNMHYVIFLKARSIASEIPVARNINCVIAAGRSTDKCWVDSYFG